MPTDATRNAKVERRLAAVLAADIAGYCALMGADGERSLIFEQNTHHLAPLAFNAKQKNAIVDFDLWRV